MKLTKKQSIESFFNNYKAFIGSAINIYPNDLKTLKKELTEANDRLKEIVLSIIKRRKKQ